MRPATQSPEASDAKPAPGDFAFRGKTIQSEKVKAYLRAWHNTKDLIFKPYNDEALENLRRWCYAEIAGAKDDTDGFTAFYQLVYNRPLPPHARDEWLPAIYTAKAKGKGVVIEAFRGSGKTSALSVAWVAFKIGHHPADANLILQVSDHVARDTCQQITDLIEHNQGWKAVFPHIRPDKKQRWHIKGYEVKDTSIDYNAWRDICAQRKGKDPTLLGLGYKSRSVIGKHPTGVLLIDDIHDENNTRFGRELEMVQQVLTGTILPTVTAETWQVVVGTPWVGDDVLAYLKATGRYLSVSTPAIRDGKSVWPERFTTEEIERRRQESGEIEFARMYLLDLAAASGAHLRRDWLNPYPTAKIDPGWPVVMGVDYASTADKLVNSKRDYFTVAVGRALPGGSGMVLVDGYRGRVSQGEAEHKLKQIASLYPTLTMIGVEALGKGEEFYHLMLRSSALPIVPMKTGQSKGERFERGMAPLFQFRRAWVADIETPFIRAFKQEWVKWPHAAHDDTLDAVYWMLYVGASHLMGGKPKHGHKQNPFTQLGRT